MTPSTSLNTLDTMALKPLHRAQQRLPVFKNTLLIAFLVEGPRQHTEKREGHRPAGVRVSTTNFLSEIPTHLNPYTA